MSRFWMSTAVLIFPVISASHACETTRISAFYFPSACCEPMPIICGSMSPIVEGCPLDCAPMAAMPLFADGPCVMPMSPPVNHCEPAPLPPICENSIPAPPRDLPRMPRVVDPVTPAPSPIEPMSPPPAGLPSELPNAIPETAPPSPEELLPPLPTSTSRYAASTFRPANKPAVRTASVPTSRTRINFSSEPESSSLPRAHFQLYPNRLESSLDSRYRATFWNLSGKALSLVVRGRRLIIAPGKCVKRTVSRSFDWNVQGKRNEMATIPNGARGVTITLR